MFLCQSLGYANDDELAIMLRILCAFLAPYHIDFTVTIDSSPNKKSSWQTGINLQKINTQTYAL